MYLKLSFLNLSSLLSIACLAWVSAHAETPAFKQPSDAAGYFIKPFFYVLDCEATGSVEPSEVDEHFSSLFFRYDLDQSRSISQQEFVRGNKPETRSKLAYIFNMMDLDKNGTTSAKEYREHVVNSIKLADLDKDGELHHAELGLPPMLVSRRVNFKSSKTNKD